MVFSICLSQTKKIACIACFSNGAFDWKAPNALRIEEKLDWGFLNGNESPSFMLTSTDGLAMESVLVGNSRGNASLAMEIATQTS